MSDYVFRRPHDYRAKPSSLFALLAIASATSGVAAVTITPTGELLGSGQLAGTASIAFANSGTSSGSNLSGTADLTFTPLAVPTALGQVTGTADMVFGGTGALDGPTAHTLVTRYRPTRPWFTSVWYSHQQDKLVIFPYSQTTGIAGQADIAITPTASLTGAGRLLGASGSTLSASGVLSGSGALASAAAITITPTATLTSGASGAFTGTAALTFDATALLQGSGALSGIAANVFGASSALVGAINFSGTASMTFSASALLQGTEPPRIAYVLIESTQQGITIESAAYGNSLRA